MLIKKGPFFNKDYNINSSIKKRPKKEKSRVIRSNLLIRSNIDNTNIINDLPTSPTRSIKSNRFNRSSSGASLLGKTTMEEEEVINNSFDESNNISLI